MDADRLMEAVEIIVLEAGIKAEDMAAYLLRDQKHEEQPKDSDPVEILRGGLVQAKDLMGLEYDDIGKLVGGVTGGAVGHWVRGRTRPSHANRVALYHWLRAVEDAIGVILLPKDFTIAQATQNGEHATH